VPAGNFLLIAQDHGALDCVLQFPHIAWPAVCRDGPDRLGEKRLAGLSALAGIVEQEFGDLEHVVPRGAQRRQ
jgi:hypothetical protein